ncbi:MAG: transcription antitermination factor NusB [Planctomycetes bacterium]|nr:transcription antitermination factor NusB [Planctomycetota bacterium]
MNTPVDDGHRSTRSQGRELALKYLYSADLRAQQPESFHEFAAHQGAAGPVRSFAEELVKGVQTDRDAIDALLSEVAANWTVARMAAVDRNVLRIGCHELKSTPETPVSVVIDEAVEIAKRYGSAQSGAFVNGLLDKLRRKLRPEGG